jgi:small subunit ribosomal protein S20
MANHKSALKRVRQSEKEAGRNRDRISRIRTFIKKFISSLGSERAPSAFSDAQSELQKGVSKGVLHKNTANRNVSRLNKMLKASATSK